MRITEREAGARPAFAPRGACRDGGSVSAIRRQTPVPEPGVGWNHSSRMMGVRIGSWSGRNGGALLGYGRPSHPGRVRDRRRSRPWRGAGGSAPNTRVRRVGAPGQPRGVSADSESSRGSPIVRSRSRVAAVVPLPPPGATTQRRSISTYSRTHVVRSHAPVTTEGRASTVPSPIPSDLLGSVRNGNTASGGASTI